MANGQIQFIECSSLSISYDVLGIATVSFTVVANHNEVDLSGYTEISPTATISVGDITFTGYLTSVQVKPITGTTWYEYSVSLVMTSER